MLFDGYYYKVRGKAGLNNTAKSTIETLEKGVK